MSVNLAPAELSDSSDRDAPMDGQDPHSILRVRQFGELLGECHRELFTFIYSLVQHHADAEDVYQQVAIVLWEKFDQFQIGTNFAAWATKVAHLTARDFMRSRRRRIATFSRGLSVAAKLDEHANRRCPGDVPRQAVGQGSPAG
jgi:DNA-directed RNA polymerase specialized sigma24 family protein